MALNAETRKGEPMSEAKPTAAPGHWRDGGSTAGAVRAERVTSGSERARGEIPPRYSPRP